MMSQKIFMRRSIYGKLISFNNVSETSKCVINNVRFESTVDPKEIEFFSKMNNEWWDPNGHLRLLHLLNPNRVKFVRDGLANTGMIKGDTSLPLKGTKIVDVGCGGGILSEPLARIGAEVTGIDTSAQLIDIAKKHALLDSDLLGRLNYVQTDIETFEKENKEKYEAVVASEVIEHVNDPQLFLKCCSAIVKPGGSLFITTPNRTLLSWMSVICAAEYLLKIVPVGTHEWNKFIPPEEVQRWLENYGLKTKLIHGLMYNPLKREWIWSSNTTMFYALHAYKK
ncbi:PREDICTED: ubiquinone biosynthesis O-methyltransferase, mitochondrial [Polistes dominula]|uniref:Ubiquinone biosynthesis O-methyltransferase, mitochondrial n=1 Tax=Polistes dominula TaxID=743375 RepID=A0ABM1J6B4_POLDO|nr:PREDICTED: ubiquinone biosynthesis O-methyltransferase, mitochondrial [Polistes dominula]XP_015188001.1 PREDICTED: ubiquinone biosynthesis O-methyltransferase, mitochondrial [Polistes dominula]XP_015188002.1 PREDICTED: ubiquinone biosynthesis O-methyltransferase, mitochondrial [Polistes dominula]